VSHGTADGDHRLDDGASPTPAPPAATNRRYLRNGLPAVYLDQDFTMRFVGSLEEQLDPIVATLDSLVNHVSPATAPEHILRLEAAWLGLVLDEDLPVEVCRALVRNAPEVGRRRGTVAGLELLLRLTFPDLALTVTDGGRVIVGEAAHSRPPTRRRFVVRCPTILDPGRRAAIVRVLERERPALVTYDLIDQSRDAAAGR
jgi:phage tail-like protein